MVIYQKMLQQSWGSDWGQFMITFSTQLFLGTNGWHLQRVTHLLNRAHAKLDQKRKAMRDFSGSELKNWKVRNRKAGMRAWPRAHMNHKGLSTKLAEGCPILCSVPTSCGDHKGCLLRQSHSTEGPLPGAPHSFTFPFQIKVTHNYIKNPGFRMNIMDSLQAGNQRLGKELM